MVRLKSIYLNLTPIKVTDARLRPQLAVAWFN